MDAKRVKLDQDDGSSRDSITSCSGNETTPSSSVSSEVAVDELKSPDPFIVEKALKRLKGTLRNKMAVARFMNVRSSEVFPVLLALLNKAATDIPNKTPPWSSILKETTSVIANCCNYSVAACMKMAGSKITHLAMRVFESSSVSQDCKASMARLIANMNPPVASHRNSSLVDRLVLMLELDDNAATTRRGN
ncbi:hypothetical protein COOONC_04440 [Cooperia oncophora]